MRQTYKFKISTQQDPTLLLIVLVTLTITLKALGSGIFKMNQISSFENFSKLKELCRNLIQNPKNIDCIKKLNELIEESSNSFIKIAQPTILSTFYPILKSISENKRSYMDDDKQLIVNSLKNLFSKSVVEKLGLFFNIYAFLLFEIYDHLQHKVLPISEEYKLSILECTIYMTRNLSSDLLLELYQKQNAPKLCQMLYVAIEIARTEKMKKLKITAIECIMSIARVLDDDDFQDIVMCSQVSQVFLFFLPGLASGLKQVALEGDKLGHAVPVVALKAWGRLVTLMMQNYNMTSTKLDTNNIKEIIDRKDQLDNKTINNGSTSSNKRIWKSNAEIKEYVNNSKKNSEWYNDTDKQLKLLVIEFLKLTNHPHYKVRLELSGMCELLINHCFMNMPKSSSHLIEIVITLTEDEDENVSKHSNGVLTNLSSQIFLNTFTDLLETLEEGFINVINRLPRTFNSIDEREQLSSLNLLTGYLKLFGVHKLNHVLLTGDHLNKLLRTLIHISELENSNTGLFEEYSIKDLDVSFAYPPVWKKFRHFKEDRVRLKIEKFCNTLAQFGNFKLLSDSLLDIFIYENDHRKEAIFILNEVIAGIELSEDNFQIIKDILNTYLENKYWQVPLTVSVDEFWHEFTLLEVQQNAIQMCFLIEGIGKIALVLKTRFTEVMFKTLYPVLEKAGNSHWLVRTASLLTLRNIILACNYSNLTNLITENIDYFTYHVERRLNKIDDKEDVLNVFSVVLKYSTMDVLEYVATIIEEVLVLSCDRFKEKYATAFLQVFKCFIKALWKWLNIKVQIEPVKSREQKQCEMENFQVSGIRQENTSIDTIGKSSEELLKEDMQKTLEDLKKENEEPEVEEYKKPEPPIYIRLTIAILTRSLHFLPSKDKRRKLLVLEILSSGLEIVRDWEDELLPVIHQIWSPLVERFKEFDEPVIINYSFQLLVTLARLSKEFIRMRTTKEALPSIFEVLEKLSKSSYLKDKGSAYRYSQDYKLQLMILGNLGRILVDLDVQEEIMLKALDIIFIYASDKQPIPLQVTSMESLKLLAIFNVNWVKNKLIIWTNKQDEEYKKNVAQLSSIIEEIKI